MPKSLVFNPITGSFDEISTVALTAVGAVPNADGASIDTNQNLTLQPADATHPGVLTAADWNSFNNKLSSSLTNTHILVGNGSNVATDVALSGDATLANTGAMTLNTVNASPGSFGSASSVSTLTVNAKGLVTTAASTAIQIAESQVTNLVSDLAAKQSTTLTNTHILVGNGSNVATDVALSGDATLANTGAMTLATVNAGPGSFGSASSVGTFTVNAKGLVTTAASTSIQIAESQVTNLVADLAAKQSSTLTNTHILVGNGSNVATDVALSGDATIANTGSMTLATVNANVGSFTSANITVNAKGLITAASNGSSSSPTVVTVSSTYAILTTDSTVLMDVSGGSFTATLPTAVGVSGKTYTITLISATGANVGTLATTSSQTIGVPTATTRKLNTQGESYTIQSDGANWQVSAHDIPSLWTAWTPAISGLGTVSNNQSRWRRVGDSLEACINFTAGTTTGAGVVITLPNSWTSDNSKMTSAFYNIIGYGVGNQNSGAQVVLIMSPTNTNSIEMGLQSSTNNGLAPVVGNAAIVSGSNNSFRTFSIPILGWEGV